MTPDTLAMDDRHAIVHGDAELALASRRERAPAYQHLSEHARETTRGCARSRGERCPGRCSHGPPLTANKRYQNPGKER